MYNSKKTSIPETGMWSCSWRSFRVCEESLGEDRPFQELVGATRQNLRQEIGKVGDVRVGKARGPRRTLGKSMSCARCSQWYHNGFDPQNTRWIVACHENYTVNSRRK